MPLSSLLQKLLFVNQYSVKDGSIKVLGTDFIMLDASDLLVLQGIDKTKMYNTIKKSSKENMKSLVTHAEVYKNIKGQSLRNIAEISKKIGKSDEGVIKALQDIFEIYGLGKLHVLDIDNEGKSAILRIDKSTLAREQMKSGRSKGPICTLTAGILAGIFSYIFNKNVDCVETECLAMGKDYCSFEVS